MKRKQITILTLAALLLFTAAPVYAGTTTTTTTNTTTEVVLGPLYYAIKYTDLPTEHWAEPAVRMMSYEGILAGYPDGSFQPNGTVTYGEFIRMATTMTHAVGSDTTADTGRHWAQKYYECGLNCNYYTQYDITEAQLSQPIPRGDMALILAALMRSEIKTENYGNYDTLMGKINDVSSGTKNDTAIIKSYATGALSGYPDGSFRPEGTLTRAEAASAIYRTESLADRSTYAQLPEIIKEEPTAPREEKTSTVDVDGLEYREAEYICTIRDNYDYSKPLTTTQQADLLAALKQKYPEATAKAFLTAAVTFSGRKLPEGKGEFRKQYIGNYPVILDHTHYAFAITIYPIGYTNEYWDTAKGEINDAYF